MKLFLCEKPSQAKEIAPHVGARMRGDGYISGGDVTVTWAIGHLVEQAKPDYYTPELKIWNLAHLPIVPERWHLQVKDKTQAQYRVVSKLIRAASEIVIATDADREGEVIARELMQLNGYSGPVSRLWLSAFDDASVKKAVRKLLPGPKTLPMYYAGMGRSRADWLAGMNLTMALTKAFGTGGKDGTLHCGRVQTPVLALIVRRERSIDSFVPKTHFGIDATFAVGGVSIPMAWVIRAELLDSEGHLIDRAHAEAVAKRVAGQVGKVVQVETTQEREVAPLPYSLGSLQRDASARFGMKAQAVLDAAQALYEKHKATSYPRTDCEYLPRSMLSEANETLRAIAAARPELAGAVRAGESTFNAADPGFSGRAFNDKHITAHHAIVPTRKPNIDVSAMTATERTIFDMVCRRYLGQFLGDHQYSKTVIEVRCAEEIFRASGKTPLVPGWRQLVTAAKRKTGDEQPENEAITLPPARAGDEARNLRCELKVRRTEPPRRYTEGTLLAAMESIDKEIDDPRWKAVMRNKEKAGIGTDATRAAIIEGLFKRDYIVAKKKDLFPTTKGTGLIGLIEDVSPEIADPVLTAQWEDRLSQIERGEIELVQFEHSLGEWLRQIVDGIKHRAGTKPSGAVRGARDASVTTAGDTAVVACPACGKPMRRIEGARGYFWGCSAYREGCKTTFNDDNGKPATAKPVAAQETRQEARYPCPLCQRDLRLRKGSKGRFWGCTGYPECSHTQPDDDGKPGVRADVVSARATPAEKVSAHRSQAASARAGATCPECSKGLLVAKNLKESGKAFVGCNRFPACRYFAWPEK